MSSCGACGKRKTTSNNPMAGKPLNGYYNVVDKKSGVVKWRTRSEAEAERIAGKEPNWKVVRA